MSSSWVALRNVVWCSGAKKQRINLGLSAKAHRPEGPPSAYHDRVGQVICTAGGSGGGGGWTIRLHDDSGVSYEELAKVLFSDDYWV